MTDPGVADKRLLIVESEFGRTLQAMQRDSNTLSAVIREAWDSGSLNVLTKTNTAKATNAHISIICHITKEELKKELTATDCANGFANRFLWIYSTRSKLLPFGGSLSDDATDEVALEVKEAAEFAKGITRLHFDAEAAAIWREEYTRLSEPVDGLCGVLTSRSEAHVVRLSALYATLDLSTKIRLEHLQAALAVVDYSNRSVEFIFGGRLGEPVADKILVLLREAGKEGCTRTEISDASRETQTSLR